MNLYCRSTSKAKILCAILSASGLESRLRPYYLVSNRREVANRTKCRIWSAQPLLAVAAISSSTCIRLIEILGLATSTVFRWLEDGFIAGERITPGSVADPNDR